MTQRLTLDEVIGEYWQRAKAAGVEQGLPEGVEDEVALARVSALVGEALERHS